MTDVCSGWCRPATVAALLAFATPAVAQTNAEQLNQAEPVPAVGASTGARPIHTPTRIPLLTPTTRHPITLIPIHILIMATSAAMGFRLV